MGVVIRSRRRLSRRGRRRRRRRHRERREMSKLRSETKGSESEKARRKEACFLFPCAFSNQVVKMRRNVFFEVQRFFVPLRTLSLSKRSLFCWSMLVAPRRPLFPPPTKRAHVIHCAARSPASSFGTDGASFTGAGNKNSRRSCFLERQPGANTKKNKPPSIAREAVPFSRFVFSLSLFFRSSLHVARMRQRSCIRRRQLRYEEIEREGSWTAETTSMPIGNNQISPPLPSD